MIVGDPVTPSNAASSAQAVAAQESASGGLTSDFETFLRLLTAQLSNQDPLKPMDSTEFVSQLASFSAVEQQTRTNTLLEQMVTALGGQDGPSLAGWIGREVGISGAVAFDGTMPIDLRLAPIAGAQSARLDIYDDFGTLVASQSIPPDQTAASWSGLLPDGRRAAAGVYRASVSYFQGGQLMATTDALSPALVTEVRLDARDGPRLVLDAGVQVSPDRVAAIY